MCQGPACGAGLVKAVPYLERLAMELSLFLRSRQLVTWLEVMVVPRSHPIRTYMRRKPWKWDFESTNFINYCDSCPNSPVMSFGFAQVDRTKSRTPLHGLSSDLPTALTPTPQHPCGYLHHNPAACPLGMCTHSPLSSRRCTR